MARRAAGAGDVLGGEMSNKPTTKAEILAGLKAGRSLIVDRKDCPLLPWLMEMSDRNLVKRELVTFDEQSTAYRFRWNKTRKKRAQVEEVR